MEIRPVRRDGQRNRRTDRRTKMTKLIGAFPRLYEPAQKFFSFVFIFFHGNLRFPMIEITFVCLFSWQHTISRENLL